MPSAISVTSVMGLLLGAQSASDSQRKCVGEDTGAGTAAGERADEVEGVELDALTAATLAEGTPRGAGEQELERLPVDPGPFDDQVGDEPPVVVGGELHRRAGR